MFNRFIIGFCAYLIYHTNYGTWVLNWIEYLLLSYLVDHALYDDKKGDKNENNIH